MAYRHNLERIGYHDLDGRAAFKLAMHEVEGRFFLYAGSLWESGVMVLEVTEPTAPRLVRFIPAPPNTWSIQVQVADGRMITNLEYLPDGWGDRTGEGQAGFTIWELADPEAPRQVGTWASGGRGTHRNFYDGGRYVHAAANLPGFVGRMYAAVDIEDPTNPEVVGRWWYPGQHEAAGERFTAADERKRTTGRPQPAEGMALHGGAYRSGDRLYCPWARVGMVILDVSDITNPREVTTLSAYPPLGSTVAVHTVLPLPSRGLAVINDEALFERRAEPLNYAGLVDISDEADPILLSLFPLPELPPGAPRDFWMRGGRFGPHNQHQPQGQACLEDRDDVTYLTYFNAGLQVYDISDARDPRVAAYYIPDDPVERRGPKPTVLVPQVEDVLVDRRGNIYISEKNSGLTVLRRTA